MFKTWLMALSLTTFAISLVRLPHKIFIVGDSEACMIASVANTTLSELKNGDSFSASCKVGSRIEYWNSRIKDELKAQSTADTVVVMLGTNHYLDKKVPDVKPILDQIVDKKLKCIWVGNFAVHGKKWQINSMLKTAVEPVCKYYDAENAPIKLHDGIHPDSENAKIIARDIWKFADL
jgi:lysophospholipase L1-like esterase